MEIGRRSPSDASRTRPRSIRRKGTGRMAKPTYKVGGVNQVAIGTRVYDPNNSSYYFDWDQAKLNSTLSELKALFDEVCKHTLSRFGDTDVDGKDLAMVSGSIKPGELLIRLTTKKDSILVKKYGANAVA